VATVSTEHEDVRRTRRRAADCLMAVGLISVPVVIGTGVSAALPGFILCILGGIAAIGVYRAPDVAKSRRFTVISAGLTVLGVFQIGLATWLLNR
jgi:hypothetical protein